MRIENCNICVTQYIFHGNKESIDKLHLLLESSDIMQVQRPGYPNIWLGDILITAGLGKYIIQKSADYANGIPDMVECNGELGWFTYPIHDNKYKELFTITLQTNTINIPMPKMWDLIIDKLNLNISYSFLAFEPRMRLTQIYNPYWDDFSGLEFALMYNIDIEHDNDHMDRLRDDPIFGSYSQLFTILSKQELIDWLSKYTNTQVDDAKVLINDTIHYHFYLFNTRYSFVDIWPVIYVSAYWATNDLCNDVDNYMIKYDK